MKRDWSTFGLRLMAPVAALVFAVLISSVALIAADRSPFTTFSTMLEYGTRLESIVEMVNRATPLYLAGLATAIGFKMNLFNIGVEGQYRLAALMAAWIGAKVSWPGPLHVALLLVVACAVGSALGGVIGALKVTRGVSEVISSIMLNAIAGTSLVAYLLNTYFRDKSPDVGLDTRTKALPESAWFPNFDAIVEGPFRVLKSGVHLHGYVAVAIVVGLGYYVLVSRTRFGFDLKASGLNPLAARAAGVPPNRMIMTAMLMSGAVAGLIGLAQILSYSHTYGGDFVTGLGLSGIAVALLGRNHPAGIAAAALLFGFLERSSQILALKQIPKSTVAIMQGSILLAVVVAYEVVDRVVRRREISAASAPPARPTATTSSATGVAQ